MTTTKNFLPMRVHKNLLIEGLERWPEDLHKFLPSHEFKKASEAIAWLKEQPGEWIVDGKLEVLEETIHIVDRRTRKEVTFACRSETTSRKGILHVDAKSVIEAQRVTCKGCLAAYRGPWEDALIHLLNNVEGLLDHHEADKQPDTHIEKITLEALRAYRALREAP